MRLPRRSPPGVLLVCILGLAVGGCERFYDVTNPDLVESQELEARRHSDLIARSAFQNLATAYPTLAVYSAWWTHEALVGDSDPSRNDFGLRRVEEFTVAARPVWAALALAASNAEHGRGALVDAPPLHRAIVGFTVGYALILMAEHFCEGTVSPAPGVPGLRMSTLELLNAAVARLEEARRFAREGSSAEAVALHDGALVGIARAHLAAGRNSAALAAAEQVPRDFELNLSYVDSLEFRARLGNAVWEATAGRRSLVVPPAYRAAADAGDSRISYEDARRLAQDSELHLYAQAKYRGYAAPMRLASGLEARYIAAEAAGGEARIALIDERRAIAGEPPLAPNAPADDVVAELMRQRSFEFWLEAKRAGDLRRHPGRVPFIPARGEPYYKPRLGVVSDQPCWPVPDTETLHNPNWNGK